jgi:hypothetical protein
MPIRDAEIWRAGEAARALEGRGWRRTGATELRLAAKVDAGIEQRGPQRTSART